MNNVRAAIFAAFFLVSYATSLCAQDITLTSRDGRMTLSGTFLSFDGEYYRLDTVYGALTIDGSAVDCTGPACPGLDDYIARITMSGTAALAKHMLPALLAAFANAQGLEAQITKAPDGRQEITLASTTPSPKNVAVFTIESTSTDEAFADLLAEEADLALTFRPATSDEAARALDAGLGDLTNARNYQVAALSALLPVRSPSLPVSSLSVDQLSAIYAGEINNWSAVGGPDALIERHGRRSRSGLQQAFEARVLAPRGREIANDVIRHASARDLTETVARSPFAIGYTALGEVGMAEIMELSDACAFAIGPTRQAIKSDDYPLALPLMIYKPGRRLPKIARDFLQYLRGPSAQLVIRRSGFVDQAPEMLGLDQQGYRLSNAIRAAGDETTLKDLQALIDRLSGMDRLSYTFRFRAGTVELDPQSENAVADLAYALETGVYDGASLLFVGFSDGQGNADQNRAISKRRAEAMRDAVTALAPTFDPERVALQVAAFGEAMPMACDDTELGRQINRRVEVWLK